jgi:ADP-heptose:LPS heptosyltransferase
LNKVLIIRFSSIGDIVLTSPVVRCLKNQANCEIHFLTKKAFAPLLRNNPCIDDIHTIEDTLIAELKKEKYDLVVDLHNNMRSHKIRWLLGVKAISFHKANIEKWLKVNTPLDILPDRHLVDRYFEALESINITNDGQGLDFYIDDESIDRAKSIVGEINDFVCINLGATYFTKRITLDCARNIIQHAQLPVVLIGGKDTVAVGEILNDTFPETVIDLCGKVNLQTSAAIIQHAKVVITGDSGMMHIAAAFKKKIFSIWGNTIPEFGMYPYYGNMTDDRNTIIEVKELNCRPCSKIGYDSCPKQHFKCMNDLDLSPIYEAIAAV